MLEQIKANITKNLTFLSQKYPSLYKYIIENRIWDNPIYFTQSDTGSVDFHYYEETLYDLKRNAQQRVQLFEEHLQVVYFDPYSEVTATLHSLVQSYISRLEPKARAKMFTRSIEEMILFGLLPFYHIEPLIDMIIDKKRFKNLKRIVIVEHNVELFYAFLMVVDLETLLKKLAQHKLDIKLVIPKSDNEVVKVFYELFQKAGEVDTKIYGFYNSYNSQKHEIYFNKAKELLYLNYVMIHHQSYLNALENLSQNTSKKQLCSPKQFSFHKPILIVGSGPSLEKNIDWIKHNRDRFYIISLTSTFSILAQKGIVPDALVVVDTAIGIGEGKIEVFKSCLHELSQTVVLGTFEIDPLIYNHSKDGYVFTSEFFPKLIKQCESYNKSPTAFVHALELSIKLGAQKIYIVGVDLGTTQKEKFYSQGYGENIEHTYLPETFEGNFGDTVYTKVDYLTTKTIAEIVIEKAKTTNPHLQFYNLSEGLKIKGFFPKRTDEIRFDSQQSTSETDFSILLNKRFSIYNNVQIDTEMLDFLLSFNIDITQKFKTLLNLFSSKRLDYKKISKIVKKILEKKALYRQKTEGVLFKAHGYFLYLTYLATIQKIMQSETLLRDFLENERETNITNIQNVLMTLKIEKESLMKIKHNAS